MKLHIEDLPGDEWMIIRVALQAIYDQLRATNARHPHLARIERLGDKFDKIWDELSEEERSKVKEEAEVARSELFKMRIIRS